MKKCDTIDVRKECEHNEIFKKEFWFYPSTKTKKLLKDLLGDMFLKDVRFSFL